MKTLKMIGKWILNLVKYEFFSFWLVYVGTRVSNFIADPYLTGDNYSSWVWSDLTAMFVQSLMFLLLFATTRAFYRVFFKRDFRVSNIVMAILGFMAILLGTILAVQ